MIKKIWEILNKFWAKLIEIVMKFWENYEKRVRDYYGLVKFQGTFHRVFMNILENVKT